MASCVGAKTSWSMSSNSDRCDFPTKPKPDKRGCGRNDHLTYPAKNAVVFTITPYSNRRRAEGPPSAEFIPGDPPLLGQEALSNPMLTVNNRCRR